jgi:peptidoglycan hydrolase CwlO-like protein
LFHVQLPVKKLLELVDVLEDLLLFPRGGILDTEARKSAQTFIDADGTAQITRSDFESLLLALSGGKMPDANLAEVRATTQAYSQIMAEPDISVLFNEPINSKASTKFNDPTNDNEKIYDINDTNNYPKLATEGNPLHTSTPLHPRYSLGTDFNKPKPPRTRLGMFGRDRRAVSLQPSHNNITNNNPELENDEDLVTLDVDYPWKVQTSPSTLGNKRSMKDIRLIRRQEEQLKNYEHDMSILSDENDTLKNKVKIFESRIKKTQEEEKRRTKLIEEMEHKLEAASNEMHDRRVKQNEEIRKAREEFLKDNYGNSKDSNNAPKKEEVNGGFKDFDPPNFGPPLMSSTPAVSRHERNKILTEDWTDVGSRLQKLEEAKLTYQEMLKSMEEERSNYLALIDDLKAQLVELQTEIKTLRKMKPNGITNNTNESTAMGDLGLAVGPNSIFEKILPAIAEQKDYIKDLLKDSEELPNKESSIAIRDATRRDNNGILGTGLKSRVIAIAFVVVAACILLGFVSDVLYGGSSMGPSDLVWWQKYGATLESFGAILDNWAIPQDQIIPT